MNDRKVLEYTQQGVFPSSGETEEQFFLRVEHLKKMLTDREQLPPSDWEWVKLHLKELFDFEPAFVPAFYSNKGLMPWQGGASWVEGGNLVAVQLRKGSCLGLYRREEILAHEAVHAARAALQSRKWEEFFAYMTSEKKWRRALGPIVRNPWEVWPLVVFAGIGMFWEIGGFLAAVWVALGFIRLIAGHQILRKASKKILEIVGDRKKTRAILVRLTDEEIEKLARGKEWKIGNCLRWKAIRLAYFK